MNKKYYAKITFSFLVLIVIILSLGISMFITARNVMSAELAQEKNRQLIHLQSLVDRMYAENMQNIINLNISEIIGNPVSYHNQLLQGGYKDNLITVRDLNKEFKRQLLISEYLSCIGCTYLSNDFNVSSYNFTIGLNRSYDGDFIKELGQLSESPQYIWYPRLVTMPNGIKEEVLTLFRYYQKIDGSAKLILYTDLPISHIKETTSSIINPESDILVINVNGKSIYRSNNISDDEINSITDDPKWLAMNVTSQKSEWSYNLYTSIDALNKPLENVAKRSAIIIISLLLLALLLSIFLSGNLYRPIKNIIEHLGNTSINNAHDEIDYISKTIQGLHICIDQANSKLYETAWYALLIGKANQECIDELADYFSNHTYQVLLLLIGNPLPIHVIQNVLQKEMINVIFKVVPLQDNGFAVVLNYIMDSAEMIKTLEKCLENLKHLTADDICAGLGDSKDSFSDIPISYFEAIHATSYRLTNDNIIAYQDIIDLPDFISPVNYEFLEEAISKGDVSATRAQIDQFQKAIFEKPYNIHSLHHSISELYFFLMQILNKKGLNKDLQFQYDVLKVLYSNKDPKELYKWIYQIAENAADMIHIRNQCGREKALEKVIHYIDKNLGTDLSLKELSLVCGMSPNYLSTLFKRYYNIGIADFINQQRLEEAKRLLENNNLNIDEIAQKVGFSHSSYFIRRFRDKYGMTPHTYRLSKLT